MLTDFCFWGIQEINGWLVECLPTDCLANIHYQIAKRKREEINAMNYASALLAGAKFSKPGAKVKLSDWLPYNLEEQEAETPTLSIELAAEIVRLSLPPAMVRDLLKLNLITPPKN